MFKNILNLYTAIFIFSTSVIKAQDKTAENQYFKVFDQHKIDWFQSVEGKLKSIPLKDSTIYLFKNYPVGSKRYGRVKDDFEIIPIVEYAYNMENKDVKEIHIRWDNASNSGKIKTNLKIEQYLQEFNKLYKMVQSHFGDGVKQKMPSIDQSDYTDIYYTWSTDKYQCSLELVYSDEKKQLNSFISTEPTHRINFEISWLP